MTRITEMDQKLGFLSKFLRMFQIVFFKPKTLSLSQSFEVDQIKKQIPQEKTQLP